MDTPDNTITENRQQLYQHDKQNFNDVCFTIFQCPICEEKVYDLSLLPISGKENYTSEEILHSQESTLTKIFDAEFEFLHENGFCENCKKTQLELRRIVYCFNQKEIDTHNYIDYPFEHIKRFKINLLENSQRKLFLFFDTETTGLPNNWKSSYKELSNWPRLVQIAWIVADEFGTVFEEKFFIIKPKDFTIPDEAVKVHKISNTIAMENGIELHSVLNEFNESIKKTDVLVAHNMSFDINVVASELFRAQINTTIFEKKQICTMESSTELCKIPGNFGYKFPKLSELYLALFRKEIIEAHDAAIDINVTFKCFYELIKTKIIILETMSQNIEFIKNAIVKISKTNRIEGLDRSKKVTIQGTKKGFLKDEQILISIEKSQIDPIASVFIVVEINGISKSDEISKEILYNLFEKSDILDNKLKMKLDVVLNEKKLKFENGKIIID